MKTLKFVFAIFMVAMISTQLSAQSNTDQKIVSPQTDTFKVWGACGMCKTRIEKAAMLPGVSKADWNAETGALTLIYDPNVVTNEEVQKSIVAVGHDTELFTADNKVYNILPGCCKYQRKAVHN
jgi:mercuric ion binding protein